MRTTIIVPILKYTLYICFYYADNEALLAETPRLIIYIYLLVGWSGVFVSLFVLGSFYNVKFNRTVQIAEHGPKAFSQYLIFVIITILMLKYADFIWYL